MKTTLTIGIPAYNEEANIGYLLRSLLVQLQRSYKLERIIVYSDGSTDKTVAQVRAVKNPLIKLVNASQRLGLNAAQNRIIDDTNTDVLVIINADVLIKGEDFLEQLIKPFQDDRRIGLISVCVYSLYLKSYMGRMFGNSLRFRRYLYSNLPDQPNVYLCHGSARAFSRALYKKLRWPNDVPEDAYSYFFAIQNGFKFIYNSEAKVFAHPSSTITDHIRQSTRFICGIKNLKNYFDEKVIQNAYSIPPTVLFMSLLLYSLKMPVSIPAYVLLMIFIRLINYQSLQDQSKYEIATSSKKWSEETLKYNFITRKNNIFDFEFKRI